MLNKMKVRTAFSQQYIWIFTNTMRTRTPAAADPAPPARPAALFPGRCRGRCAATSGTAAGSPGAGVVTRQLTVPPLPLFHRLYRQERPFPSDVGRRPGAFVPPSLRGLPPTLRGRASVGPPAGNSGHPPKRPHTGGFKSALNAMRPPTWACSPAPDRARPPALRAPHRRPYVRPPTPHAPLRRPYNTFYQKDLYEQSLAPAFQRGS